MAKLTKEERDAMGLRLAAELESLNTMEDEKKAEMAEWKKRLDAQRYLIAKLARAVNTGLSAPEDDQMPLGIDADGPDWHGADGSSGVGAESLMRAIGKKVGGG